MGTKDQPTYDNYARGLVSAYGEAVGATVPRTKVTDLKQVDGPRDVIGFWSRFTHPSRGLRTSGTAESYQAIFRRTVRGNSTTLPQVSPRSRGEQPGQGRQ